LHSITSFIKFFIFFQVTNKKPITVLDILEKIRLHVSVPQCDVFGYLSIESEIVILIIPVDQNPKPLQVDRVIILFTQHGLTSFFICLHFTIFNVAVLKFAFSCVLNTWGFL